jgi:hypothetical protein
MKEIPTCSVRKIYIYIRDNLFTINLQIFRQNNFFSKNKIYTNLLSDALRFL